ncbi:hypothetical protein [Bacteroides heparinolyticus]|uniref:hypothetical protein n=1 Tax=Prevotella heparinolytica TaxID=28113 RepID=UPI0023F36087|nr:hypothetical protein [Bacteroides heparinolyticus]
MPKASFLGEEEGVPRCGTTCSSVPNIRHLEEKRKGEYYPLKIKPIHTLLLKGTHKLSIVMFFPRQSSKNARNKTLLKAVFCLDPHFRVAFIQTKHTLIAAKPSKTGRKTDEVVKGIIGGKAAKPSLMIQVETGKGKINRAANWICKKVCLALFFLTTMLLSFLKSTATDAYELLYSHTVGQQGQKRH